MKSIKRVLPLLALAALPMLAFAQPTTVTEVTNWLGTLVGIIQTIFWAIAIIILLYAAFIYLTAGGDDEKIGKAKKMLVNAVIAGAIALVATGIRAFVSSLFTTSV